MTKAGLVFLGAFVWLSASSFASAQDASIAAPADTAPTIADEAVPPAPTTSEPPPVAVQATVTIAPPPQYGPTSAPVSGGVFQPNPATRPSFGTSIALHVTAAILGPIGMAGLVFGAAYSLACSFGGGDCAWPAALAIAGGVLETASLAIGISASAVHAHTRGRMREWEAGQLGFAPIPLPGGGGASLTLTF